MNCHIFNSRLTHYFPINWHIQANIHLWIFFLILNRFMTESALIFMLRTIKPVKKGHTMKAHNWPICKVVLYSEVHLFYQYLFYIYLLFLLFILIKFSIFCIFNIFCHHILKAVWEICYILLQQGISFADQFLPQRSLLSLSLLSILKSV